MASRPDSAAAGDYKAEQLCWDAGNSGSVTIASAPERGGQEPRAGDRRGRARDK